MPFVDKEQQAEANRNYKRRKLIKCLEYLDGMCVECGATSNLEFHHINPMQKSFTIGGKLSRKWDFLLPELDKCELRCRKHHLDMHSAQHGSRYMLIIRKCRCNVCVEKNRDYNREYKRKRRLTEPSYGH